MTTKNLNNEVPSDQIQVGLEIGTTKIRVCVSEGKPDGALRILGIGEAPSRGVRKGEIVDLAAAAECICLAIGEAELSSHIPIKKVSLAVTGSHLRSFTSRARLIVPKGPGDCTIQDIETVKAMARSVKLPADQILLQAIDGEVTNLNQCDRATQELGSIDSYEENQGTRLEAGCHIMYGKRNRIQRTLQCLEPLQLEVVNFIPSSVASATAILSCWKKSLGVLIIDLGGGTTDYSIIQSGEVRCSGVIPVGGDHVTNDISIGLRLPIARAEFLKIQQGSAAKRTSFQEAIIRIKRDEKLPDYEIDRPSLDNIILLRVREIFEQIRDHIDFTSENGSGENIFEDIEEVMLTGGWSKLQGISEVAGDIFKLPVKLGDVRNVSGAYRTIENPALATVIGITKYAMTAKPNPSLSGEAFKEISIKGEAKGEFKTNEDYLTALKKEKDPGKNISSGCSEDLDLPTFLRKGTGGMGI